jgi:tRNA threonylcarbamoyladenosine biosynthesis protein TsaE
LTTEVETLASASPAETEAIGARLATRLQPGDVVLVSGELGTGKTTLIRGACRALGVSEPVTSPTFTIGHRYQGRIPVSHLDLFRLDGLEGEDPGLLEDYLTGREVVFVEWPELSARGRNEAGDSPSAFARAGLRIALSHEGGDRRRIAVSAAGL